MAKYYFDTSAFVKLYVREAGTERMHGLADAPDAALFSLALTRVEVRSAIRRRQKAGDIPPSGAEQILAQFEEDWRRNLTAQTVNEAVLAEAVSWVNRRQLRALDALQLGGFSVLCQGMEDLVLVGCDREMNTAAAAEGLRVLDPAAES